jgi:hypothetical protein
MANKKLVGCTDEEAAAYFRVPLREIGREELAEPIVEWFRTNQRRMTVKEFAVFLSTGKGGIKHARKK